MRARDIPAPNQSFEILPVRGYTSHGESGHLPFWAPSRPARKNTGREGGRLLFYWHLPHPNRGISFGVWVLYLFDGAVNFAVHEI